MAGNIHFAVRPEALFLSKNAEEIKEVRSIKYYLMYWTAF